jgi:hypothetical protein
MVVNQLYDGRAVKVFGGGGRVTALDYIESRCRSGSISDQFFINLDYPGR